MLRQRLYQIVAGYEDADDCDLLRNDPTMKLVADKKILSDPLTSQPTITRLENRVSWEEIEQLDNLMLTWFIKTRKRAPKEIILDMDSTDDHGHQQLVLFNGFYNQFLRTGCYIPTGEVCLKSHFLLWETPKTVFKVTDRGKVASFIINIAPIFVFCQGYE